MIIEQTHVNVVYSTLSVFMKSNRGDNTEQPEVPPQRLQARIIRICGKGTNILRISL